jgi:hypothetical protein
MRSLAGKWAVRLVFAGLLPILGLMLLLSWPKGPRSFAKTLLFVTQVLPLPAKPLQWITRTPVREPVNFLVAHGEGSADIYRLPGSRKRAGVLVFLGIIPVPRDDPRVANLGNALARLGFVALFPWSPSMIGKRITPEEPDNMVRSFIYLRDLDYVDEGRVGMGGFCVGASMLLIAASDQRIRDQVAVVSSFGGYHNMADMLVQICTHTSFYKRAEDPWTVNHLSAEVMSHQIVEGLEAEFDRKVLTNMFLAGEPHPGAGPPAELSSDGTYVYYLLRSMRDSNHRLTVEGATELVKRLTPRYQEGLMKISPVAVISKVRAQVLIAHDVEDTLVPVEESRRLAEALAARGNFFYTEFSLFTHVTPDKQVGKLTFIKEATKLFRYTYNIIRLAG